MYEFLDNYISTPLEASIVQFYDRKGISSPQDIDLELFAHDAKVWVHRLAQPSDNFHFRDDIYTIVVDNRLPKQQQKVEMAHELGHVLLHSGRQEFMREDFRAMQEFQSDRFAMYSLAPTFMISNYILPVSNRQLLVAELSSSFDVPETFMDARLGLLEQRLHDLNTQRQLEQALERQAATYDYSYRHPLNDKIEYLVKDGVVVGRRRRSGC